MDVLSFSYLFFFLAVLAVYWALPPGSPRQVVLVVATGVWFSFGIWWHALAAAAMGSTSWLTARWIASRSPDRRGVPTFLAICICVGWFLLFRYMAPWTGLLHEDFDALTWWAPNPFLAPLGLSFIMFETIAIQADLYFRKLERPGSWWSHMVFVFYFPTRVIGPMRKYQDFVAQVGSLPRPTPELAARGLARIGIGLFKKVVLANPLGTFALFNLQPELIEAGSAPLLLLGLYSYWLFLYFDFSGYSDIAIGLSKLLGIDVPENFNRPWQATNESEYWQRWHMSLSFWVREYIYTPATIAWRRSVWGAPAGAFLSMLVLGLWHGVELRFVAFGVWHGLLLALYMLYRERLRRWGPVKRLAQTRVWSAAGWFVTLNSAILSSIFVATTSFDAALAWFRVVGGAIFGG